MALQFKNSQLKNSSVSLGGVSISLGGTDATPAFNLSDATAYPGDASLTTVGTIGSGTWQGTAIANAYVANDLTISGGTIDDSAIGGTTAASGRFTTLSASGGITGTLSTAAQTSVTSVGSLLGLTIAAGQTIDMGNNKITNVADPTNNSDAATKSYVDANSQGLDVKESCLVATTGDNITLSGTQTIDGVAVTADKRVLVKDQTNKVQNGIYLCKAGAWSRATDFAAGSAEAGAFCFVEQGTDNADAGFVCTSDAGSDVVGTDNLVFTQFSGAGQVTAGAGMTKSGNTLNVVAGTGITVNANDVQISASYAGQSSIVTVGTIGTGTWQGTAIADTYLATIAASNKVSGSAIQLQDNKGLADSSGLGIKLDGTTLALGSGGIKVNAEGISNAEISATAAIADTKLATIASVGKVAGSAVQLATNTAIENSTGLRLKASTAGDGLDLSASQQLSVEADGGTITVSASGIKVTNLGIGAAQIANSAVGTTQLGFSMQAEDTTISGSGTSSVNLAQQLTTATWRSGWNVQVFKNGQRMLYKGTPGDNSEYKIEDDGSTTKITAGAAFEDGDVINIYYIR